VVFGSKQNQNVQKVQNKALALNLHACLQKE
jgi:hypothetical protein